MATGTGGGFQPQLETPASVPATQPARPAGPLQQVAQNTYVTDFKDESVKQYEFELYSGRVNVTDRIYLIRSNKIIKTRRHYNDKVKYVICNSTYVRQSENQEVMTHEAECCRRLGNNNLTFAALVVRYITDKSGKLVIPFQTPELRLWRFGVDKYLQLKAIDSEWPLHSYDLSVVCTDEKYQKMTLGALRQCIYKLPDFPKDLTMQFEQWADAALPKIPRELGKVMSDAEILKELGAAGPAPATMQAQDAPITDFSSIVGQMPKS